MIVKISLEQKCGERRGEKTPDHKKEERKHFLDLGGKVNKRKRSITGLLKQRLGRQGKKKKKEKGCEKAVKLKTKKLL